jgi:ABC-type branched-subunit amino acid transport system ATPase component/branched-subunit amino acid ABC-type transport system permease component
MTYCCDNGHGGHTVSQHIQFLLLGLGNGAVFGVLALALVVTYRSSGVINFASGSIALYGAYTFGFLWRDGDLMVLIPGLPTKVGLGGPWPMLLAILASLVICGLLGLVLYLLIFRPLRNSPPLASAVASLGILVVIQQMVVIRVGTRPITVPHMFPKARWTLWGEVTVSQERFWFAVTILIVSGALAAMYRFTRFGIATAAVAESEKGAVVTGIRPQRIAAANWVISGAVAGLAGVLISPITASTPIVYTLFIVPALAAAVVGRFQALFPAVLMGLGVGLLGADVEAWKLQHTWVPAAGVPETIPLVIILIALIASGRVLPQRGSLIRQTLGRAPRPRNILTPTLIGFGLGAAGLLLTHGTWRASFIMTFIFGIIALSLVVVTGYAGQVSLAQLALAGTSAFSLSTFTESWNIPFPIAPLMAALVATVIGVVTGLPAVRVRGLTLGIVTLSLAYAIEAFWFRNPDFVREGGKVVPAPKLFGWNLGIGTGTDFPRLRFGFMVLAVLTAAAVGVAMLRRSRLGSAMLAMRANERSAAAAGIDVVRVKLTSFAIASFIAGLGGALLAYRQGRVTFDSFAALRGLTLFGAVYLAGITSVSGGLLAGVTAANGVAFVAMDRWLSFGDWYPVITGVLLIFTVIMNPEGIVGPIHQAVAKRRGAKRPVATLETSPGLTTVEDGPGDGSVAAPTHLAEALTTTAERRPDLLSLQDVTVSYGGVRAVDSVTFDVPTGKIVGLVGPNGAGKTSLIDAITGFAASSGAISIAGQDLGTLKPHQRVKFGLSRTFQAIELYDDLSVHENIIVGLNRRSGESEHTIIDRTLGILGIGHLRDRAAGDLSQGQRQLVSIARALVAQPTVLLLDEPAAGLDSTESQWLGGRLRAVRDGGVTILLVDHDVGLVFDLCDEVHVLDFGQLIASGPPDEVRRNPAVAAAYLGASHGVKS